MVSFELGKEIKRDVFRRTSDLRIPHSDALLLSLRDPTVSEVYNEVISLISIYKYYAIDIADPRSMQDACHIELAQLGVSVARG